MVASTEVRGAAPPAPRIWMLSPAFDLTFFIASALVTVIPWIAIERYHVNPFYIVAGVAITSNGPHLASTWTRVYLDGNERGKRPFAFFVMPLLIAAAVVTMLLVVEGPGSRDVRSVLFYWAFWHFTMQNWGILRIYQRRVGDAGSWFAQLERGLLWLCALYPMLSRLRTGPWELLGAQVRHPAIPLGLVHAAEAALIVAALVYAGAIIYRVTRGERIGWIRPLFLAAAFFGFLVPFVMIKKSGTAGFAAAAAWHAFQYLGIVWYFNRNRWRGGVDPKARVISWLSQPRRAPLYFLGLLAMVSVFYAISLIGAQLIYNPETWASLIWLSLTLGHYWLDGIIWKLRKPELQKQLVTT